MKSRYISIIIGEVKVEGRIVHHTSRDIDIEITKPYKNLSTGSHIPYFAMAYRSFDGVYGEKRMKELLNELYEIGNRIEKILSVINNVVDNGVLLRCHTYEFQKRKW